MLEVRMTFETEQNRYGIVWREYFNFVHSLISKKNNCFINELGNSFNNRNSKWLFVGFTKVLAIYYKIDTKRKI